MCKRAASLCYTARIFDSLNNVDFLSSVGVEVLELPPDCDDDFEHNPVSQSMVRGEQDIVEEVWRCTFHLARTRSASLAHHSHCYPVIFARLVSDNETDRALGLQHAERAWTAISTVEVEAKNHAVVKGFFSAVPFMKWVWPREVFLGLAQWSFKWVDPGTAGTIKTVFEGYGQSLIVENFFNQAKDQYRDGKGTKISRERRLLLGPTKRLISEVYGRKEVSLDEASSCAAQIANKPRNMPAAAFESQAGTPSVKREELMNIEQRATWPTFSPLSAHSIVTCWQLILELSDSGQWGSASSVWKSIFVRPGVVLKSKGPEALTLVLTADQYGVLGFPVHIDTTLDNEGATFFRIPRHFRLGYSFVTDFDEWEVFSVAPCGPMARILKFGQPAGGERVSLAMVGPVSILEHAAKEAFIGITAPFLKRLIRNLGLSGTPFGITSDSVISAVEILLRGIFKGISDELLGEIMAKRIARRKNSSETLLANNVELLDEVMEVTGKVDAKRTVDDGEETQQRKNEATYLKGRDFWAHVSRSLANYGSKSLTIDGEQAAASRPQPKTASAPKLKVLRLANWKLDHARSLLPKIKGCLIQDYPFKSAFQVYYSEAVERPRSKHFTFHPERWTEQQVLLACVRWAWYKHHLHTGEQSPHQLPDEQHPKY